MAVEAQCHEETGVFVGQVSTFGFVVRNPGRFHLRSRGDLKTSRHTVVKAGPAGHVGRHIDVTTVQIHHGVSGRSAAWVEKTKEKGHYSQCIVCWVQQK